MLVPQGMAYALLAGMPPIYGLYAGLVPPLIYVFLGTSRQLSLGPVALSSLLLLAGISPLATPESATYIELVILAGLLIGLAKVLLSWLRLGFLVNFLSQPVLLGFTSGAAIIIAASQLKDLLGFSIPRSSHLHETLLYAITHIGQTNWIAVAICLGSIVAMISMKKLSRRIPHALVVVLIGSLLSWGLHLPDYGLAIVGQVPEGLPGLNVPEISWERITQLMPTVITVTIISFVECISIAKVLEAKHQDHTVRPNQELFALGIAKVAGAFFQALPVSGSFTRSAINHESGAKTGMASLITVLLIVLTLAFLTPLFYYLPKAVLAAIILMAVRSLFDWRAAVRLYKSHRRDFIMLITTFWTTVTLGVEMGVLIGVLLSLSVIIYRSSSPHVAVLGHLAGTNFYRNINRFAEAKEFSDILILRFDDQLYFANATFFKDTIKRLVNERKGLKLVIIDATSMHELDSSGTQALEEVVQFLKDRQIKLSICGVIGPVRDRLYRFGLMYKIGAEQHFMNVHQAVLAHQTRDQQGQMHWSKRALQTNAEEEED